MRMRQIATDTHLPEGVVQQHVHEFAAEAMNARFTELSEAFEGQWPVEWCEALVSANEE